MSERTSKIAGWFIVGLAFWGFIEILVDIHNLING